MRGWEIVKKDLRLLLRDRRALATLILLPLIFIAIIGMTTGQLLGWADRNMVLKIGVVNQTDYDELRDKVEEMQLPPNQTRLIRARHKNTVPKLFNRIQDRDGIDVVEVGSLKQAQRMYEADEIDVALIIGPNFIDRVTSLKPEDLMAPDSGRLSKGLESLDMRIESDVPTSSTHSLVEQLVYADVLRTVAVCPFCENRLFRNRIRKTCDAIEAEADQLQIDMKPLKPIVKMGQVAYQEVIPGMTVMFVFFLVNIMARSFIQERELGTLRRLRMAPIGITSLLAGKTIPFFVISFIQTMLLFLCGRLLFGMDWGSEPLMLIPVIISTSVAATALGLLVATLVRTDSQVSAYANLVVIGLAGISGCFMPRDWLPEIMKEISLWAPHAWALEAYNTLLMDARPNLTTVVESCAMLIGFGALFFTLGCVRFSKID